MVYLKSLVYAEPINNLEQLQHRLQEVYHNQNESRCIQNPDDPDRDAEFA